MLVVVCTHLCIYLYLNWCVGRAQFSHSAIKYIVDKLKHNSGEWRVLRIIYVPLWRFIVVVLTITSEIVYVCGSLGGVAVVVAFFGIIAISYCQLCHYRRHHLFAKRKTNQVISLSHTHTEIHTKNVWMQKIRLILCCCCCPCFG